jgi:hypothetical protein
MALKHVLLKNPRLKGWEYGMLRELEDEIATQTGATVIEVPDYGMHKLTKKMGHSMRMEPARKLLPKKSFPVEADVLWYILMGPENYELDLFKDWNVQAKYRIVYIFDTLEPQFGLMQKLFSDELFNIRITSFNDAVPYLEKLTARKWHYIEQAVPLSLFKPVPLSEKIIPFSSYGRRFSRFHDLLVEWCRANSLYYDYTTHGGSHPTAPENELYKQYAWHLSHSMFTVSWPVELTNPKRAGSLHPITCRWFEAASSGTIILGKKPDNPLFDQMLYPELVIELDPTQDKARVWNQLDSIYANRLQLVNKHAALAAENSGSWTWANRVSRMLQYVAG